MAERRFDVELEDLTPDLRWREWMARVEAVLFASDRPLGRDVLCRLVGRSCVLELLLDDIANELQDRPYELAEVAGGWMLRSRARHAAAIRYARGEVESRRITRNEALVLTAIAYMQPVTRSAISRLLGREVSRETVARLNRDGLIARGPRSPEPGAPYTYVTTSEFLTFFGLKSLRDLPDLEALEDAGLLAPLEKDVLDMPLAPEPEGDE